MSAVSGHQPPEQIGFPPYLRTRPKFRVTTYVKIEPATIEDDSESPSSSSTSELAEDGRKRSTLPPLDSEPSFLRSPRKGAVSSSFHDEQVEGAKRLKKVSVEVDRKIVNHLRRDLARRLEKRIQHIYDPNFADAEDDGDDDAHKHAKSRKASHHEKKTTIFDKYSETGEKKKSPTRRPSNTRPRASAGSRHLHNIEPIKSAIAKEEAIPPQLSKPRASQSEGVFGKGEPLPDIHSAGPRRPSVKSKRQVSVSDPPVTNSDSSKRESNSEGETFQNSPKDDDSPTEETTDRELAALITNEDSAQPEEEEDPPAPDVNFRNMVISPVPTPVLNRPETREMTRLSMTDTMTQVLSGYVHRRCPPDNKMIRLYVMGGYTDTSTERTVLLQHIFPKLREFCTLHGRDLQIYDPHWGVKDSVSDDHRVPEVIGRVIAKCQESTMGLNLLMILGEKYGPCLIPAEIPTEEFESIVLASKLFREKQVNFIRSSIADIETSRTDRERLRQLEMETASIATTVTFAAEGHIQRSESITSQREEHEEEGESTAGDVSPVKYRPPNHMAKKEQAAIRALKDSEEDIPDVTVLEHWYTLDENCNPPVFRLQNISSEFKDIVKNDGKKRDVAKSNWFGAASRIRKVLQTFAPEVVQSPADRKKYFISDLEFEIEHAMESEYVTSHTLCIMRTFNKAGSHVADDAADDYLDIVGANRGRALNASASKRFDILRDEVVLRRIPLSSITEFAVEWNPHGIREHGLRDHVVYMERLCKTVLENAKRRLAEYVDDSQDDTWRTQLYREVTHHVRFCHERVKKFHGRKDVLTLIKSYIRSGSRLPLVLYGKSGSGKSAILSKTAKEVNKWFRGGDQDIRVLLRFVGTTECSSNARILLHSLCMQLCYIFGNTPSEVPSDFKGLLNDLEHRLHQAQAERPLVLIIDGVDALSSDHDGRKMTWLPRDLPEHVKIIVSTLPEDKFECLPSLKKLLSGKDDCFVEVPELPEVDAAAMVNHWLHTGGRCLTTHQSDVLMTTFAKCPVPLFLKIAYNETLQWKSYSKPDMCKLADGVKKLGTLRFARLERDHGEPLVRRALGYITAGRHGVTISELEDLLSLDDAVMDEVDNIYRPSKRRLPPLLWMRLLEDVSDLVTEYAADNVKTVRWAHSQFHEAAKERYLDQRDKAPSYHKALAEYFMGTWAGKPKPYTGNERGADRLVAPQDFYVEPEDSNHDGRDRTFNLRKINELPYHLLHAQLLVDLKHEALLNFEWILAKLCGTSLRDLLDEYSMVIQTNPDDPELKLVSDTLHLSGPALRQEPRQLASQLVGRLDGVITRDAPRAPGDPRKYPNLQKLLDAAKDSSVPALIPSMECLTPPGGILFDLLSGHTNEITAVTLTSDGMRALTSSLDDTIKLWDLRSGRVVKTLEGVGAKVTSLRTAKNNTLFITVEGTVIKIWSARTGACLLTADDRPDPAEVCVACEGQVLVAIHEGTNTFRSWGMDSFKKLCEVDCGEERGMHKERSVLVIKTSYNELVLHAFRSANTATVQHAKSGRVVRTLTCNEPGSSIAAVAVSREYHVVCCRQQYMQLHELHVLELFDARKGTYLRSVRGCVYDHVTDLHVNLVGSHALAVCSFDKQQMSDIAVWNLETEDHKHLARHPLLATAAACLDFRFCLTAAKGQNALRIWNLSGKINQPAPRLKKQLGVLEVLPMQDNPRYCVAKAVNHGPISVWNVAKGKCLQAAVRVERGLTESSDAVVVRNTRLVILTDRGFSSVTEDSRPVFQTVLVYDLKAKRYERKLTGCYIAPAPSHEYVLLEGERLMGPSETRTHFIIWSLVSGHAVQRIKTNFKEMERRKMESGVNMVDATPGFKGHKGGQPGSHMTPWDRRAETKSARKRRVEGEADVERQRVEELKKEKENGIEQFVVSGDQKVLVASFYAHHLVVFDIETQRHVHTLHNQHSLLLLHVAALTHDGSHLVHANYDERDKVSYVTLWDCSTGEVKRRLKRETDVCALGISNDATRVVIGKAPNLLHIWDPVKSNSLRRARGYDGLHFSVGSRIFLQDDNSRAVVFAEDISLWDLDQGTALAVFTPDTRVLCCQAMLDGQLTVFGLYERQELIVLKLSGRNVPPVDTTGGVELFGETTGDTSDEDDDGD
ncbi:NACHT and WD repeat domain-containing protein 2-like isoform X2 [Littorina saxatilis]|uniref:NACHT and WD repeat domain-containing protein 2-like isoform X2 n=1 Tax=Littorina saxatilis TaxID=31220 RepID=UPI0038B6723C